MNLTVLIIYTSTNKMSKHKVVLMERQEKSLKRFQISLNN